jgi:DNA polymerase-3 subunit beta
MNVTIARAVLVKVLDQVKATADAKATPPICADVLIEADSASGAFRATTTDLHRWTRATRMSPEGAVSTGGAIALPHKELLTRVKAMAGESVTIAVEGFHVTITCGAVSFILRGHDAADYPAFPAIKAKTRAELFSVSGKALAAIVGRTSFAASDDGTSPHLNCALLESDGASLRVVTMDGHRLVKYDAAARVTSAFAGALVPKNAWGDIGKIAKGTKVEVRIERDAERAYVHAGEVTYVVRLVDAQFPPYQQVIPNEMGVVRAYVSRTALASALQSIKASTSKHTGGVEIRMGDFGRMHLSASDPKSGTAEVTVPIDYVGAENHTRVNVRYLMEALDGLDSDDAEIAFHPKKDRDPCNLNPFIVRERGNDAYLTLTMPMRV